MSLSNFQIDEYFSKNTRYRGCYPRDSLPKKIKPNSFYIINLDDSNGNGTHWTCIINFEHCLYFDSYGAIPPTKVVSFMKTRHTKRYYNCTQIQAVNSDLCGYFCIYVINELEKGHKFLDICSRFSNDYSKNDDIINEYFSFNKTQHGGSILNDVWNFIQSSKRDNFPPSVRTILAKYGNEKIIWMKVCRTPIDGIISKALNWLTLGLFQYNMKKMNYESMFHLYLLVRLSNGLYLKIEKNHVIKFEIVSPMSKVAVEMRDVPILKNLNLQTLISNAVKFRGPQIYVYDSVYANCQDFVLAILQGNELQSDEAFIKQKAEEVIPTYLQHFNRAITDTASAGDVILNGYGV